MHETQCGPLRVHRMNRKAWFEVLTRWRSKNDEERTKNDEERWRIFTKSLTETSRKRCGSASTWIFFTETIFLTNFKRILNTRRAQRNYSALFPLFIGEKREVVAAQLTQASWVASTRRHCLLLEHPGRPKWSWLLFAHPFLLNTPLCFFFCWFLFRNITELYGLCNDTYFLSGMSRNLTDYAAIPFFTSRILQSFTNCTTMLPFNFRHVAEPHRFPNDGC